MMTLFIYIYIYIVNICSYDQFKLANDIATINSDIWNAAKETSYDSWQDVLEAEQWLPPPAVPSTLSMFVSSKRSQSTTQMKWKASSKSRDKRNDDNERSTNSDTLTIVYVVSLFLLIVFEFFCLSIHMQTCTQST